MSESDTAIENSPNQVHPSYIDEIADTPTQTKDHDDFKELISYLGTRKDITEVFIPSGGLVRVKNKDGLYNYFGSDKKVISKNWFNFAKDFRESADEPNKFVAMVGKKTEETGIHAGTDYYSIDTHGEMTEFPKFKTLPKNPIFHLPDIDEEKIAITRTQRTDPDDESLLTDQEIETAKKIAETKENFKGSGIVEYLESLRDNFFLTKSGTTRHLGEKNTNEKKSQKKLDRLRKKCDKMIIEYGGDYIAAYYKTVFKRETLITTGYSRDEKIIINKRDSGYKLGYFQGQYDYYKEQATVTTSKPEKIITWIARIITEIEEAKKNKKKWTGGYYG